MKKDHHFRSARSVFSQSKGKKMSESVEASIQPCSTSLLIREESDDDPLCCTKPFILLWEELIIVNSFDGQPTNCRIVKRSVQLTNLDD